MQFIHKISGFSKKATLPTMGAFYQCYKQPKALIGALQHFRNIYPDSTIVLVSNNGDDMRNIAKHFNCNYIHESESTSDYSVYCRDESAVKLYVRRIFEAAKRIKEDYIILLADDVHVLKPISGLKYDLNGGEGQWRIKLKLKLYNFLGIKKTKPAKYDTLPALGDAFVLRKNFVLEHFGNIETALKEIAPIIKNRYNNGFPSDVCINMLTIYYGGSIGNFFGWYEKTRWFYRIRRFFNTIEVSHQEKDLYNKPLSAEEKSILEGHWGQKSNDR